MNEGKGLLCPLNTLLGTPIFRARGQIHRFTGVVRKGAGRNLQ